ncbi:YgfZ/GcvT domain-containing protein [Larsenimonas suaedae]|uniref:Folate-binding protein n=1 Tax=Larsenimonas suaedae TaxID=1851019 RepID=A0ABU1GXA8_9GAMM|nr:folate-binding protein [Larsenimonas suaedae]MCM2971387.1 folate-binding protein [Larsenimonas suaedae]MDR5896643.1 folate-binding protein [Larsenimonas suaedae]
MTDPTSTSVPDAPFAIVELDGPGSATLLQGQSSAAIDLVRPPFAPLIAFCTPKGRMIANGQVVAVGEHRFWLLLDAGLADTVMTHLKKFAAFYKTELTLRSDLQVQKLIAPGDVGHPLPDLPFQMQQHDDIVWLRHPGEHARFLRIATTRDDTLESASDAAWRLEDIDAGLCFLDGEQSEQWLPQMLNWEALGGISFKKGCYTGQEVVARAHYRGQVKKRLVHLSGPRGLALASNDQLSTEDGKRVGSVMVAAESDTTTELLAVVNVSALDATVYHDESRTALTLAPLPYALERVDPETLAAS